MTILITGLDIIAAYYISNYPLLCLVILLITGGGIGILYYLLVRPLISMKKKIVEMEEENRRIENMRREFVANVTHELKTPLTSISGFIETLQDGAADDREIRTRFIDIIAIETSRLKRLIEDILVLSEIENKKESLDSRIKIKDAIEGTVDFILPIAQKNGIQLYVDVDNDLWIEGSEDRFRQMMVNLIENAIKYSGDGKRVWVKGHRAFDKIIVSVKDEGIGINSGDLERLFERFYRVDKSRSREAGGTGLGLSIVKHTAALFDAELDVESTPARGSTFRVIFKEKKEEETKS